VEPAAETTDAPPRWLQTVLSEPPFERRRWETSIAPTFIGLFLWVVYYDQLPAALLPRGGIGWSVAGAGLAGLLGFLLFYYAPAMWGFATGRPLVVVATGSFGVRGAAWVPGLLLALVQVVWFAVATSYGTDLCLRGLVLIGLLEPRALAGMSPRGLAVVSPLFAVTALVWSVWAALVGRWLVRVIAALMNVYPILPAFLIGASTVVALRGFRSGGADLARTVAAGASGWSAMALALQMILGFIASSGLASADWGAASRSAGDVRRGGFVSVALASWIVATLATLTVAGSLGLRGPLGGGGVVRAPRELTFTASLVPLFGDRLAGLMDLAFGLAALAPGVYAAFALGTRLHELRPHWSRTRWTLAGAVLSWPLIVTGFALRLFDVFSVVGALVAPAAGVIAADYLLARGRWPGARRGVNPPGMIGWASGALAGLLPTLGGWLGWPAVARWQPAVLLAFAVAFLIDLALSAAGLRSPIDPRIEPAPAAPPGPTV
jgi:cytosine permease